MSSERTAFDTRPAILRLLPLAGGALLAGWAVTRALQWSGGVAMDGGLAWLCGVLAAASIAGAGGRALGLYAAPASAALAIAAFGWSLSSSIGWTFSVLAGGPISGVATAAALGAGRGAGATGSAAALVLGATGAWIGWRSSSSLPAPVTSLAAVVGAGGAMFLATPFRRAKWWTPVMLVAGWGSAWVIGYAFTSSLARAWPGPAWASAEVLMAFAMGGVVTAWFTASPGRPRIRVAASWALAGLLAASVGFLLDAAARTVVAFLMPARSGMSFLAPAQALGMAVGGILGVAGTRAAGHSEL